MTNAAITHNARIRIVSNGLPAANPQTIDAANPNNARHDANLLIIIHHFLDRNTRSEEEIHHALPESSALFGVHGIARHA